MKKYILILLLYTVGMAFSQEEKKVWRFKEQVSMDGYIKYLPSISFTNIDAISNNSVIHNRINFKVFFNDNFSSKVSVRNRIFFGDQVTNTPNYGNIIAVDNGELDLSFLIVNQQGLVIHSIFDRAYIDYAKDKWQIRLGRQRINWGINLAWNTNDLFNAYNIIDYDYEERAGTDAVRIQYYGENSSVDIAYKLGKDIDHSVIGALYRFNKWAYDFQVLVANFNTDIAIGAGWAGTIKNAGFKGEATFFKDKNNSDKVLSISSSVDYYFKKGMYLNATMLYSSNGKSTSGLSLVNFTSNNLSAKELMPTKYSYLVQASNEFNPRLKASLTTIYGQGMDILFVMPSIDYSIKENWDINLTGQVFYAKQQNVFKNMNNSIFLRLQYSY